MYDFGARKMGEQYHGTGENEKRAAVIAKRAANFEDKSMQSAACHAHPKAFRTP